MNNQQPTPHSATPQRGGQGLATRALAVASLCLVAIRPILGPPLSFGLNLMLPCSNDVTFHLLRLTQLDHLIRQGIFYSRWAPDMAQGYGYPIFNFYAPLSYYVAAAVGRLGLGLTPGLLVTLALGVLGSGLAAYRLARDHFGHRAALIAAIAYAYAPYQAYDVLFRSNLAESAAWPLLPLALWTMGRLARRGGRRWLAATALTYAAVLLTHNVFALIFSPLLAAYGFVMAREARIKTRAAASVALALGLGLSLAVFFWLPALAERSQVHSDRLLVPPTFVYWNNFIHLDEIFAAPRGIQPDLINPSPPRALGLVLALLAIPSLFALLASWASSLTRYITRTPLRLAPEERSRDTHPLPLCPRGGAGTRNALVLFFAATLAIYIWMMTPASELVWQTLPLIEFVQFPWRLLGPAALCLAMLVAASIDLLPPTRLGGLVAGAVASVLVLSHLFWLDPRYCPSFEQPTIHAMQAFERQTGTIGTTAKGEYLPRTVTVMPGEPASSLLEPADWLADVTVIERRVHALDADMVVESPVAFRAVANAFDYPGWQARVDGRRVPITPSLDEGLITFEVPPGRHHLAIRFTETPLRLAADLLSAVCLLLLLALLLWPRRQTTGADRPTRNSHPTPLRPRGGGQELASLNIESQSNNWPWIALGLTLFAVVTWLLPQINSPLRRPRLRDGRLNDIAVPLKVNFENALTLLGYDSPLTRLRTGPGTSSTKGSAPSAPSGGQSRFDLYWAARTPVSRPAQTTLTIIDAAGALWSPKQTTPPRDFRSPPATPLWKPGTYAQDSHLISVLPGTPPGIYRLRLTLFDRETLAPVSRLNAEGQPVAPDFDLGSLTVLRPRHSPDPADIDIQYRVDADLGPIRLVGANLDREDARPGDPMLVTLFWLASSQLPGAPDLMTHLALVRLDGKDGPADKAEQNEVAAWELPPVNASWPTSRWQAGELWRGQHLFRLPASLESGAYIWRLQVYSTGNLPFHSNYVNLGILCINAPDRLWETPALEHLVNVTLSDQVTLLGFNLQLAPHSATPQREEPATRNPTDINITLAWQGQVELTTSYRVFLHLLDPDGNLLDQADGEPVNWTRPTTGWARGEVILDKRVLNIPADAPPGQYTLVAGLYAPDTGERLALPDDTSVIPITTFTVEAP